MSSPVRSTTPQTPAQSYQSSTESNPPTSPKITSIYNKARELESIASVIPPTDSLATVRVTIEGASSSRFSQNNGADYRSISREEDIVYETGSGIKQAVIAAVLCIGCVVMSWIAISRLGRDHGCGLGRGAF